MIAAHRDRRLAWLILTALETSLVFSAASRAQGRELLDGTPVQLRLQHAIHSDSARVGQMLEFVVARDVTIRDEVVIARGTIAMGQITDARRASWEYSEKHPRLAFKFIAMTAADGAVIALRAAPHRGGENRVVLDHGDYRLLLWASEADTFDAYVSGNYLVR